MPDRHGEAAWLLRVAQGAGGGVPVELPDGFLSVLVEAATTGRCPDKAELDAVGLNGRGGVGRGRGGTPAGVRQLHGVVVGRSAPLP
ncbi:hypothetical protein ACQP04_23400 [Pseudonocardia halophobica]|uniref:hypothetical protein n=1 Tax=Pseudonocardia halophobica TaxID=29401 RepID=UPI003D9290F6